MKIYLVGGAVRNEIMGIPAKDNDYVVVGATEQQMLDLGFSKVGADFPVYLHPETGEEYALARRERSTGDGYNDFEVEFGPDVTLEEDLGRRDFTMNAIAKDIETGELVDPFGGVECIKRRKFVAVHPNTFKEDPVRILRLARFAAQFPAFEIADKTIQYASEGNLEFSTAERVQLELIKALNGVKPSKFFDTIITISQHYVWFDEVFALVNIPQPIKWHVEGDAYTHTMMVLDSAAKHNESLEVRFGALVHDFGKASTWPSKLPSHHGHEQAGVPLVNEFCDRLKISNDLRLVGVRSAAYHTHVHNSEKLTAKAYVKAYESFKNCHNLVDIVARVAFHDNEGKLPYTPYHDYRPTWNEPFERLFKVKLSGVYTPEEIEQMTVDRRKQVLHKLRLSSI